MPIKVVTDSTADLPESVVTSHGITVVPLYINIGSQSYLDGVELSRQEFYEMLPRYRTVPTTSAPGIGSFVQVYNRLAAVGASEIISVHIPANLSNTCNVARLAAQEASIPVTVFDSGQVTLGTGLLAMAAAEAATAGASMAEVVALLQDMGARTHSFAAVDTLEFLRRSGRLTGLQSALGTFLQVKPLLKMYDGNLAMEKTRTRGKCIERLIALASACGRLEQLALVHTHALERVRALGEQVRHLFPAAKAAFIEEVTPVIGAHVGPGAVGLVCVSAR